MATGNVESSVRMEENRDHEKAVDREKVNVQNTVKKSVLTN